MRFLFAIALTSLVLFESVEVGTPGPATQRGLRTESEPAASCQAAAGPEQIETLMCRAGSLNCAFDDGPRAVAD
ncbi:MAG TPA: hypothetical protein VE911_09670 [Candidatus Nitrosopolaris sp.]|nr:hypothetical protein [Candidatus Nitrosopolaris sp.]